MKSFIFAKNNPSQSIQTDSLPSVQGVGQNQSRKKKRRGLWIGFYLLLLFLSSLFFDPLGYLFRNLLIVETPMQAVDVVLVDGLGGNLTHAVDLIQEGMAKSILITAGTPEKYQDLDAPVCLHFFIKKNLLDAGVPESIIHSLPKEAHTLLERQELLRSWMRDHACRSYLQFSHPYSSRFKAMLHRDTFPENDVRLVIYPSSGKGVWRKEWMSIQNTLIRMLYWNLVYRSRIQESLNIENPVSNLSS